MVRQEHPNPQFERESWLNLNGEWAFAFDFGKSGLQRKWYAAEEDAKQYFTHTIQVPFCPESKLSGIEYKDLCLRFGIEELCVWRKNNYRARYCCILVR